MGAGGVKRDEGRGGGGDDEEEERRGERGQEGR